MKKTILLLPLVTLMTLAGCSDKTSVESTNTGSTESGKETTSTSTHQTEYTVSITGDANMIVGRTQTLSALVSKDNVADESLTVNWLSEDEETATVDYDTGLVTALKTGTVKITACMNDAPYEMGSITITITAPEFDASLFPIKDNYTATFDCAAYTNGESGLLVSEDLMYYYAEGSYYSDGYAREAIFCFDEEGYVYNAEIVSATCVYYYDGEYLTDSDKNPYKKEDVLAEYDGTSALSGTDLTYFMYNEKYDVNYFATSPKEGETVDAFTSFAVSLSALSLTAVVNAYASIEETPISLLIPMAEKDKETGEISYTLVGSVCGLTADGSVDMNNMLLTYSFFNFGTSDLGIKPTKKYFHEGEDAGEEDGDGEDFDGGKDDSGDTRDTTGDGE